jgi:hypothetical protein
VAFILLLTENVTATIADLERSDLGKYRKVVRCLAKLEQDPNYPSLASHRFETIKTLGPDREPIGESYVENDAPSAGRIWWFYGPDRGEITVVNIGPHP